VVDVRILEAADLDASWQLGRLAFGWDTGTRTPPAHDPRPDDPFTRWGAFDESGSLVGKAVDLHHEQWWGGRVLPASGVAGVAVAPEHRRRGVTRAVLTRLLDGARDRGAVVTTLFCTSSAVYRSLGFEICGAMRTVALPTAELPIAPRSPIRLRAGTGRDWPAVRALYDEVAAARNGHLTRRGRLFAAPTDGELPDGVDGVTLAETADGSLVGYATWERGRGYHDDAVITVHDCLALSADAAAALVGTLAGWATVAPTTRLRLSPVLDAVDLRLPLERAREHRTETWMHRPLDVVAAVAARGWPVAAAGSVSFRLHDPVLVGNAGAWTLQLSAGEGRLEPSRVACDTVLDVRGWSLLWCGAARTAQLRGAGLLTGDRGADAGLDLLLGGGGPSGLLDYF
jgi:predicted acetyltransferase